MDEGGFDGGMDSGGFDGGMDSSGFEGDFDSSSFEGDLDSSGFEGDFDSDDFDGDFDSDGFDGDFDSGDFDGDFDSDSFEGDFDSDSFDGDFDSDGFEGDMDSDGFDGYMDFDAYNGDTDADGFEDDVTEFDDASTADVSTDSDVIPLESLNEAAEPMPDSEGLFDELPAEFRDAVADVSTDSDVIPLESLNEAPEPIADSDALFDALPAEFNEGAEDDAAVVTDEAMDLTEGTEPTELDEPAEVEEQAETEVKPDYSFHWSGYEEHAFPETDQPKTLSREYSTTPDDAFHPASLDNAEPEAGLPEQLEPISGQEAPISKLEEIVDAPEAEALFGETADYIAPETDQEPDADVTLPENQMQIQEILENIEQDYDQARDREIRAMARDVREFNLPQETTEEGITRGRWEEDSFVLDDDFVPSNFNPEQKTISEIRNDLQEQYGLELKGIPYRNGEADFSDISVAHLEADDIAAARLDMDPAEWKALSETDRLEKMSEVFDNRPANFSAADRLAAERGLEIPSLGSNYTKEELDRKFKRIVE